MSISPLLHSTANLELPSIADCIPQIIWITNPEGVLTYCNQRWVEYSDLDIKTTLAGGWIDVVHPNDVQITIDAWNKALAAKISYEAEFRPKRAIDETYRWHLARGFPIKSDANELIGWIGTSTDIDDLKKTTEALQKSENSYSTLVQALHSVYWAVDPIGAIVQLQPSWQAFSGQTWEEYKNFGWITAIHPEDRNATIHAWQEAVKATKIYQHIARFWSAKHNDYIYCIARAAPLIDENGIVIKWIGSCLDIHDQKQAEKKLQEVSDHLQLALKSAHVGTWTRNFSDNTINWDENTYQLFGLNPDVPIVTYEQYINLIDPRDRKKIKDTVENALATGNAEFDCHYRIIWPDGTPHFLTSKGKIYRDAFGQPKKIIGICFDVTESKRVGSLTHQGQLDFAENLKNSSVSEVASYLAHELNQPLTTIATFIQGCITQLEDKNANPSKILYALKESAIQVERAGKIIHRIKNSVRKKYLHLEDANYNDIVMESIKFINYAKDDNFVEINFCADPNLPIVRIDKIQIQQVIINLLRNSTEAMAEYSTPNPQIFISYVLDKNMLTTKLTDNGPGFPHNMKTQIDTMNSTKANGMGIGLSICRSIIEAHGGQLTLNATIERGAQVQFTLPITLEKS